MVKLRVYSAALALLNSLPMLAQGTISTVAGGNGFLDNIPATQARLSGLSGVVVDEQGNAYIGDGPRIRLVSASTGIISTVAGTGTIGCSVDGPATQANLSGPQFLTPDGAGNILFFDNLRILKFDPRANIITTIFGSCSPPDFQYQTFSGMAVDSSGDIYVTDDYNDLIYRISESTGALSTFAGIGMISYTGSPQGDGGPATQAGLGRPYLITVDPSGNVYFAEQYWVRRIDAKTGIISTVLPISGVSPSDTTGGGGPYKQAVLRDAAALATDAQGNLYISDGPKIWKIDWTSGIISNVAGSGQTQYEMDGIPAVQANLSFVIAMVLDGAGNLWLADQGNTRLFEIPAQTGLLRTIAGTSANGDGGPALGALLSSPNGVATDAQGDIYIGAGGIRRVDHVTGKISTVSAAVGLNGLFTLDGQNNIFYPTSSGIDRVDANSGSVTTVAGIAGAFYGGFGGDGGAATSAQLSPSAVAVDPSGNLYIADNGNFRIRRVDAATGIINTIAGTGQNQTYSGATGAATQISIGPPNGIALGPGGDVYWTTPGYVLKLDSSGNLSVVAGNGGCYYAGDGGLATLATLCQPYALAFDEGGDLFVSESQCGCVRRIDAGSGVIQTIAGTGMPGSSSDGIPATRAALSVGGISYWQNTLLLVDGANMDTGRVRAVTPPNPPALPQPPAITEIVDAVDFRQGFASPGAILSIMGNYLGSPAAASGQFGANGLLTASLGGDAVTFEGIAGPLLYVSAGQINTIVPYELSPGNVSVQVQSAGGTATFSSLTLLATSLSLFPGLVFNPDGSLNGPTNFAPQGATLVMYGTGMGQTNPPGVDGAVLQGPVFPQPVTKFGAAIQNIGSGNTSATVAYLGPLPDFVSGAVQANIQIPATAPPGANTLLVGPNGFDQAQPQVIYMLSSPPVLSSLNPASPIPQTVGQGTTLTVTGTNLVRITGFNFFFNGQPYTPQQFQSGGCSSSTLCTVFLYFAGQAGSYAIQVVNAANQVSNQLAFTVQTFGPPTVTEVVQPYGGAPIVATKGLQQVEVVGSNFQTPLSATLFYNGSPVATFSSTDGTQIVSLEPSLFAFSYDFNGQAGNYGIQVTEPGLGSSGVFNFTVKSP